MRALSELAPVWRGSSPPTPPSPRQSPPPPPPPSQSPPSWRRSEESSQAAATASFARPGTYGRNSARRPHSRPATGGSTVFQEEIFYLVRHTHRRQVTLIRAGFDNFWFWSWSWSWTSRGESCFPLPLPWSVLVVWELHHVKNS